MIADSEYLERHIQSKTHLKTNMCKLDECGGVLHDVGISIGSRLMSVEEELKSNIERLINQANLEIMSLDSIALRLIESEEK